MEMPKNVIVILFAVLVVGLLIMAIISDMQEHNGGSGEEILEVYEMDVQTTGIKELVFNQDFKHRRQPAIKFYQDQFNKTPDIEYASNQARQHQDNIATLNVHMFRPINMTHTLDETMIMPINLMKQLNISILALEEVPLQHLDDFKNMLEERRIYHTISDFDWNFDTSSEPITNVVISRYPIVVEKQLLLPADEKYIFRHRNAIFFKVPRMPHYEHKLFAVTHLEVAEKSSDNDKVKARKYQLRTIMSYGGAGPDIIMGDLNFAKMTPEYNMISKQYVHDDYEGESQHTTPFGTTVDYIWHRKRDPAAPWTIKCYAINYPLSDHRPIIGVYYDVKK
jgi:endonuclease/exonuclease/phosphatase family metal-dependent hydrolase